MEQKEKRKTHRGCTLSTSLAITFTSCWVIRVSEATTQKLSPASAIVELNRTAVLIFRGKTGAKKVNVADTHPPSKEYGFHRWRSMSLDDRHSGLSVTAVIAC